MAAIIGLAGCSTAGTLPTSLAAELPDPTSYPAIGWVVVIIAAVAMGGNAIFDFWAKITAMSKEQPPPSATYMPIKECAATHTALNIRMKQAEDDVSIVAGGLSARSAEIFNRINPIDKQVTGIERSIEFINQRLIQIDLKLDRYLERKDK